MPSYVENHLVIKADNPAEILDAIRSEKSAFDFEKLIPIPEELKISEGSLGEIGEAALYGVEIEKILARDHFKRAGITTREELLAYLESDREIEYQYTPTPLDNILDGDESPGVRSAILISNEDKAEALDLGEKYHLNRLKYGARSWYWWAIENWGVKASSLGAEIITRPGEQDVELLFFTAWDPPIAVLIKLSQMYPEALFELHFSCEDNTYGNATIKAGDVLDFKRESAESVEINFNDKFNSEYYERVSDQLAALSPEFAKVINSPEMQLTSKVFIGGKEIEN